LHALALAGAALLVAAALLFRRSLERKPTRPNAQVLDLRAHRNHLRRRLAAEEK
jgi:hypothetical protein